MISFQGIFLFLTMCTCVCICVNNHSECRCPQRAEQDTGSPEAGIVDSCELHSVGAANRVGLGSLQEQ